MTALPLKPISPDSAFWFELDAAFRRMRLVDDAKDGIARHEKDEPCLAVPPDGSEGECFLPRDHAGTHDWEKQR